MPLLHALAMDLGAVGTLVRAFYDTVWNRWDDKAVEVLRTCCFGDRC